VPLFAHPRLTTDAYGSAVSTYFKAGIQVPIVIFADPTGREIPGTRLDDRQAQVKATFLEHAKKALESFRGGLSPEKAKEAWAGVGRAFRLRSEAKDSGDGVDLLRSIRDSGAKGSALRDSVAAVLDRIERDEALGSLEVALADAEGEDPRMGFDGLFGILRDFPGLPSAEKAKAALDRGAADPARKEAWAEAEKEHRGWIALREADRLARAGKAKEAAEARAKVAKEWEGTPPGDAAAAAK
jgi:hypothetical protein